MNFQRTYKPELIFTSRDLFEYVHQMEIKELVPLKSQLKYDTELTNEQKYELNLCIALLSSKVNEMYELLESRLSYIK